MYTLDIFVELLAVGCGGMLACFAWRGGASEAKKSKFIVSGRVRYVASPKTTANCAETQFSDEGAMWIRGRTEEGR